MTINAKFPIQKNQNLDEILILLNDQTHHSGDIDDKFTRWITQIVHDINHRCGGCFWLERLTTFTIEPGDDVIDLTGDLARVNSIHIGPKLKQVSLNSILSHRATANLPNNLNAGEPEFYALEAGKRVHLFPAPSASVSVTVKYERPPAVELLPDVSWYSVVMDGVISKFYAQFDRDNIVGEPMHFYNRYKKAVLQQNRESNDSITHEDAHASLNRPTSNIFLSQPIEKLTPASLRGIGYVSIELGEYPLQVQ